MTIVMVLPAIFIISELRQAALPIDAAADYTMREDRWKRPICPLDQEPLSVYL